MEPTNSQNDPWEDGKYSALQRYCKYYETLGIEVPLKDTIVEKISDTLIAITTSNEDKTCEKTLF